MPAFGDNVGLLFKIKADSSDAVKDIGKVETSVKGVSSGFAALAGPGAVAAAAVAAVGTAAIAAGTALYKLTKTTADFGSEIFDATEKTGLAAETISSLKVAADQSGSSLEAVTAGLARFAKTIGAAENGDGTAVAAVKKLNVTSKDLDTALGQALATIAKYPPGVAQMTAAQAAFGRSGAELLPFIKSFDGDLPGLIEKCKKLGLTMSDENARAADAFGDQMDTLNAQFAAVGRTLGFELMPIFMDMATSMSNWLSTNQGEIRAWADTTIEVLRSVITMYRDAARSMAFMYGIWAASKGNVAPVSGMIEEWTRPSNEPVYSVGEPGTYQAAPNPRPWGNNDLNIPQKAGKAPKDDSEQQEREAYQRRIAIYQREEAEKIAISKELLAVQENNLSLGVINEEQFAQYKITIENKLLQNRIDTLKKELQAAKDNHQETLDLESQIRIAEQELTTKKIADEQVKYALMDKRLQREVDQTRELLRLEDERRKHDIPQEGEIPFNTESGSSLQRPEMNTEGMTQTLTYMQEAFQSLKAIGTDALNSLAQGIGSLVQNWVLLGSTGPNAMKKLVASVLAGVAAQAAVLSIFELAKGFAALFWNPAEAAAHFKAAALFGIVAVGTGLAGRGIAGNSFAQGGSSGGSSVSGQQQQQGREDRFSEPFKGFGWAVRQSQERMHHTLGALEEQLNRLSAVSPGHVLVQGASSEAGANAIFNAHTSVLGTGSAPTESMARAMGRYR